MFFTVFLTCTGGMWGRHRQAACSKSREACGGVEEQWCTSGLSTVDSNQANCVLCAWCSLWPPHMGPAEEHHAAGDHRKDIFWQVVEDGHEEWDFVSVLICFVCVPLSSQGDSHGCVWRLRTAKHILRSSTGTWVRNNRNTVFYKRFYDTYDCGTGEVGEYDEWSLLRNVFVIIDISTWCFLCSTAHIVNKICAHSWLRALLPKPFDLLACALNHSDASTYAMSPSCSPWEYSKFYYSNVRTAA